jgi:hypothetical protein
LREVARRKGRKINQKHKTYDFMYLWASMCKELFPDIKFYTYNPKSLLADYLETWKR